MAFIIFSTDVLVDGNITSELARQRWSEYEQEQIRGKPLFIHSMKDGKYMLHYHQSYKTDLCDTVFLGEIFEYEESGSQILGKVTASKSMRRFGIATIIAAFPVAWLVNVLLFHVDELLNNMEMINPIRLNNFNPTLTFFASAIIAAGVAIMSQNVDKRRVKDITEHLHKFLNVSEDE
ncbi:MAG: hypothetical protein FWD34_02165 [Oscillospiraceae bacterium]|nr:hypothetical protein [Oscillospiraceae bacterium]